MVGEVGVEVHGQGDVGALPVSGAGVAEGEDLPGELAEGEGEQVVRGGPPRRPVGRRADNPPDGSAWRPA